MSPMKSGFGKGSFVLGCLLRKCYTGILPVEQMGVFLYAVRKENGEFLQCFLLPCDLLLEDLFQECLFGSLHKFFGSTTGCRVV